MRMHFARMNVYGIAFIAVIACVLLFSGNNGIRPSANAYRRTVSYCIAATEPTPFQKSLVNAVRAHPGQSGFHLILNGHDALMLRLDMIEAATRSLDIQYYSFQDDVTGKLLLEALLRAADRGVRVRMLIDDIAVKKSDIVWKLLSTYPGIELRIFNPFATYSQSWFGRIRNLAHGLKRFDKRMHNKLFIADNQLSIMGGRNLGDAYFDSSREFDFRDVDILVAGPVTAQASGNFDAYWNDLESYPFSALIPAKTNAKAMMHARDELQAHWQQEQAKGDIAFDLPLPLRLASGTLPLIWADASLAADSPFKIDRAEPAEDSRPATRIRGMVDNAQHEFIAFASYFVPENVGVEWLKQLHARGVKIRILTNSLASTDVVAVSVGYSRFRNAIVADGVELYEMKPIPGRHPRSGRFASASRASLHTKVYVIDRRDIAIGTFNFDPRSTLLNTEIDLVIHSPELAEQLVKMFDHVVSADYSYHVVLSDPARGVSHLEWITRENGRQVEYGSDPKAGFWRNVEAGMLSFMPWGNQL